MLKKIVPASGLRGVLRVPGDKSITHRALILGALAEGETRIEGLATAQDCAATLKCLQQLGVAITEKEKVYVQGCGLGGWQEPRQVLEAGNSGTTLRLLAGALAGQSFLSFLSGDASLNQRPMGRVVQPLRKMGAQIWGRQGGNLAPLAIRGTSLKPISYLLPQASAQIKSALLLAGLQAPGWTEIREPVVSRNHTELLLASMGASLEREGKTISIKGLTELKAQEIAVPGDFSAAAFFLVAGLIVPHSHLRIESVGLNPTRTGLLEVLNEMGANLRVFAQEEKAGERRGTIEVKSSVLRGVTIGGELIPRLIDELPILAVAGLFARGITEIRDAAELKVKECNRLRAICEGLTRLGGCVEELPDGLRIRGGCALRGAVCQSYGDHRMVMALAIAALGVIGETRLDHTEAVAISFPGFWKLLDELRCEK